MAEFTAVLAVALGLFASAPAAGQSSNVTLYGLFHLDYEVMKVDVPGPRTRPPGSIGLAPATTGQPWIQRVTSNTSNFGIRGTEDLGGGLFATFQIEQAFNTDVGGGTLAGRNSGVGLGSYWGQIIVGNWDAPYIYVYAQGNRDDWYNTTFGSGRTLMGMPGYGVVGVSTGTRNGNPQDATFDRRLGNSVQYFTPDLYGFSARIAYSTGEQRDATGRPWILSTYANYERPNAFYVSYGYERHADFFGLTGMGIGGSLGGSANPSSTDQGHKAGAGVYFGGTFLGATVERLKFENHDTRVGNVSEMHRDAWYVVLRQALGAGMIRAGYGQALDAKCSRVGGGTCDGTDTGAKHFSIGYSYTLSKRTDVWVMYAGTYNDQFAAYPAYVNSAGVFVGGKYDGVAIGLRHVF
jgi:predicted porin